MRVVKSFLLRASLMVAALWTAQAAAAPNIVIFISDDMGWGDVGYHGSDINTPQIDRLASEGVILERFYVQSVCSPTRASLMTGRMSIQHGVANPFNPWFEHGLPLDEKLLPEYLRERGYATNAVGKWHLGPNELQYHPLNRGFDTYYGSLHGYAANHETRTAFGRIDWQRDGKTVIEDGYDTHLIRDEAIRLIENRDADRPFFLYVTFTAPHTPLQAPEEAIAEYAHIDGNRRVYAAMVSEMDRAIGQVVDAIDREEIANDTFVMFFTDNGGVLNAGASNGPFRGGKATPFEGGVRVPAVAYWPGVLAGGTRFSNRIMVMDLLPTLMDLAELPFEPAKPLAGRSVWPALAEGMPMRPEPAVLSNFQAGVMMHAYFRDEWKFVRALNASGELQDFLFDIYSDPSEEHDVSADFPEVAARMAAELDAMPKVVPVTAGQRRPDIQAPGAPSSIEPDTRPAIGTPFAESGPVPYPERNYVSPD